MNVDVNKVATIVKVKSIKGTSFIGVRNYENKKGEFSNQTFLVGFSYFNHLENDLNRLTNFDLKDVFAQFPNEKLTVTKAYTEMMESLVKRTSSEVEKEKLREQNDKTIAQSDAQKNAYTFISNGLYHKDGILYVKGLMVRKTVIGEKAEYPKVNSALKTIIKRVITKKAELKAMYFRTFILPNMESLAIQGVIIPQSE
jgi:hypothetical protein